MRYCQENKKECALAHSRAEARLPRQPSTPAPSAHPRGAFLSYGNEVSYTIKKPANPAKYRDEYFTEPTRLIYLFIKALHAAVLWKIPAYPALFGTGCARTTVRMLFCPDSLCGRRPLLCIGSAAIEYVLCGFRLLHIGAMSAAAFYHFSQKLRIFQHRTGS